MIKYKDQKTNTVHITYSDQEVLKYTYDPNADIKDLMSDEEKEELERLQAESSDEVAPDEKVKKGIEGM